MAVLRNDTIIQWATPNGTDPTWVGYWRPGATDADDVFLGAKEITTDIAAGEAFRILANQWALTAEGGSSSPAVSDEGEKAQLTGFRANGLKFSLHTAKPIDANGELLTSSAGAYEVSGGGYNRQLVAEASLSIT